VNQPKILNPSKVVASQARDPVGELLLALVDRVSHRGGDTLALMSEAGITLPQVLFLSHLRQAGGSTASELARRLNISLPAISQMVDRLVHLDLLSRAEDAEDRRRKRLATTPRADQLLDRLTRARAAEYSKGTARLSPAVRKELAAALARAVRELS
jgi:DNA-binding MarR family transcriptional regulator